MWTRKGDINIEKYLINIEYTQSQLVKVSIQFFNLEFRKVELEVYIDIFRLNKHSSAVVSVIEQHGYSMNALVSL